MVEDGFGVKAAQAHALLAELAAAIDTNTSGVLAVEVLPELLGAVRQGLLPWYERSNAPTGPVPTPWMGRRRRRRSCVAAVG